MSTIDVNQLEFVLAVIVTVVGAIVTVFTSTPSRTRLLKDIEILERMSPFETTAEEKTYLLMIRASIGTRIKELALPVRRVVALSIVLLVVFVLCIFAILYAVLPLFLADPPAVAIVCIIASFPIGYALGTISARAAIAIVETKVKRTEKFVDTVLRENEDGMPESGENDADGNEPHDKKPDECEYVESVHEDIVP